MNRVINWGVIGLGNAARCFSTGFLNLTNAKLLAVASKNLEKLEYFKKKYHIEGNCAFTRYEDLLSCKDIDIVYIALPNSMHSQWIINSARKTKNILVEKPATLNSEELRLALLEVNNNNVFFTEGFLYRHHPQTFKIIELIKKNSIGEIYKINISFGNDALGGKKFFGYRLKKPNKNKRLFNQELGGGAILDMGCYVISMATLLAKNINSEFTNPNIEDVNIKVGKTGVDEHAFAKLYFQNKLEINIETSIVNKLKNDLEIFGTKGKIQVYQPWFPNSESIITQTVNDITSTISIKTNLNIYAHQVNTISNFVIKEKDENYSIIKQNDMIDNMRILDKWKNSSKIFK
jgi:predicted dehydrogenase